MVFSTYVFVFWFLPIVMLAYGLLPARLRNAWLAVASYVFYGWWRPEYCALLALATLFNYQTGARIAATEDASRRRRWLTLSVIGNLSLLGYFKYAGMFSHWVNKTWGVLGGTGGLLPALDVLLPIGISFYIFQALSYSVDIARGEAEPAEDLLSFAAYIAMFPQLIAGPIVRYGWIADELRERAHSTAKVLLGIRLFILGLAKKVLLADVFALAVPVAFEAENPGFLASWTGVLGYSLQIYFDFSAYSDMAVGLGLLMGFGFPQNFDSPYKSASITEFWRRWHISLSTWLRDYLYIPLGGNRLGPRRTYVNLMLVMLLGGLWHGASLLFVIWGGWHGLLLCLERRLGDRHPLKRLPRPLAVMVTSLLVIVSWIPFRAASVHSCTQVVRGLFAVGDWSVAAELAVTRMPGLGSLGGILAVAIPLGFVFCWWAPNSWEYLKRTSPACWGWELCLGVVCMVVILSYDSSPFLYFRF